MRRFVQAHNCELTSLRLSTCSVVIVYSWESSSYTASPRLSPDEGATTHNAQALHIFHNDPTQKGLAIAEIECCKLQSFGSVTENDGHVRVEWDKELRKGTMQVVIISAENGQHCVSFDEIVSMLSYCFGQEKHRRCV